MSDNDVPDLFADSISLTAGPYGFTLTLYVSEPPEGDADQLGRMVARVRLAPELVQAIMPALEQGVAAHNEAIAARLPKPEAGEPTRKRKAQA